MESLKALGNRILAFITKDVQNENETKKVAVILRMVCLMMVLYFVVQDVFLVMDRAWGLVALNLVVLALHVVYFGLTYRNRTQMICAFILGTNLVWPIIFVALVGWSTGVQLFHFVLLVLFFVSSYTGTLIKIGGTGLLFVIRISLFAYVQNKTLVYSFPETLELLFQFVNTFFVFAIMAAIVLAFSQNSLQMEKKLRKYNEKIREMASRDPLTGLYNRRYVLECMSDLSSGRTEGGLYCVAIGDIDFFKHFNDTYGHEAGDEVLRSVAHLLKDYIGEDGIVGRWGGEEFLIVFKQLNGDVAYVELETLRSRIQRMKVFYGETELSVTMTFGLEEYNPQNSIDEAISAADKKLYMGKAEGRNKVVF